MMWTFLPLSSVVKQELMWIFPSAIANILCRAEACDGRDVREKGGKKGAAVFVLLGTEKKQDRPVKGRDEVNPGTKSRWDVMSAQRNRFVRNASGVKETHCRNGKETVWEEKGRTTEPEKRRYSRREAGEKQEEMQGCGGVSTVYQGTFWFPLKAFFPEQGTEQEENVCRCLGRPSKMSECWLLQTTLCFLSERRNGNFLQARQKSF